MINYQNANDLLKKTVMLVAFFVSLGLLINRLFLSVELTDEAYSVAEIYYASSGSKPFSEIWDPHTGWFLYVPLLKVYSLFSSNMDGIILFFRIMYLLFITAITIVTYLLLRNNYPENANRGLLFCISASCFYVAFSVPQIGYNAGVSFLLILVFAILYSAKNWHYYLIAGLIMGITCLLYPTMAVLTILTAIVVLLSGKKFKYLISYVVGVATIAIIFTVWLLMETSVDMIFDAFHAMTSTPHEANKGAIDVSFFDETFIQKFKIFFWKGNLCIWGFFFITILIVEYVTKKTNKVLLHIDVCVLIFVVAVSILSISVTNGIDKSVVAGQSCFVIYTFSSIIGLKYRTLLNARIIIAHYLVIGWLLTYCFTSDNKDIFAAFNASGALVVFTSALMVFELCKKSIGGGYASKKTYSLAVLYFAILIVAGLNSFYSYVYRDNQVATLNAQVECGIYKGLYTTNERKEYVEKLEKAVKKNVKSNESICVVSDMPALYLMSNAKICAPQTWDAQFLNRGYSSAKPLLSYFKYRKLKPDVMIACDYNSRSLFDRKDIEIWAFIKKHYRLETQIEIEGSITKIWRIIRNKKSFHQNE